MLPDPSENRCFCFLFFLGPDRLTDASENVSDIFPLWHPTDPDAPISKNGRLNRFWPNPKPHRDTPSDNSIYELSTAHITISIQNIVFETCAKT